MAPTGHTLARERLSAWLHRHGPASAPDAARALGVSPATLLRMLPFTNAKGNDYV